MEDPVTLEEKTQPQEATHEPAGPIPPSSEHLQTPGVTASGNETKKVVENAQTLGMKAGSTEVFNAPTPSQTTIPEPAQKPQEVESDKIFNQVETLRQNNLKGQIK